MQCVTPMFFIYDLGDKKHGRIVPREEVLGDLNYNPNHISGILSGSRSSSLKSKQWIKIPCRKCYACKLNYSAEWATRITLECKKSEHNYFITFTYDDENLPENGSLQPEDMKTFINSLRKQYERAAKKEGKEIPKIKYFYAGEYGETTGRPHYHMILMNCELDLNQFYDTHIDGQYHEHWKSHQIENLWNKGLIDIGTVEWSSAAYVARYCMKKQREDIDYEATGRHKEFVRMSQGIGMDYFKEHMTEMYQNDELIMKTIKGNTASFHPPKAFDKKYKELYPREFNEIKRKRIKEGNKREEIKKQKSNYTDLEKLIHSAESVAQKQKMLPRELET